MSRSPWSNLAQVVYKRTYSRSDFGKSERWEDTVARVISGNIRHHQVSEAEIKRLEYFMLERKAMPAGRGLWFSGSPTHEKLGGAALNNCWFVKGDDWRNLIIAQDLLMLGGGVGMSVERELVSKLPAVKKSVSIERRESTQADLVVADSREGWCELIRRVFEAYFETGKSFSYSTAKIRSAGAPILGFGGKTAGPAPLILCVEKLSSILAPRAGRKITSVDMMDLLCVIGEMVVSGNVRRSAILILGDASDPEYLRAKRFDLAAVPPHRAMANLSVVANRASELGPLFWETYEHGEPFGIVHRENMQKFGRMGELKHDDAIGVNPCAEATLTHGEPCNLQELFLPNLSSEEELIEAARLMHRWGKRVTCEKYHIGLSDEAVKKYRRVGTGITGCLQSKHFNAETLDRTYAAIQEENRAYSQELGIPESIRSTLVKPSGTLSLLGDCLPGIHPAYSRYFIRRVRFSRYDPILGMLSHAGYPMEPVLRFDGTRDLDTLVVPFYCEAPSNAPVADESWDTFRQLEVVKFAQKHWADQSVSVTVYYKRSEIPQLKKWVQEHLSEFKTISFLAHSEHGFAQAPLEAISKEEFEARSASLKVVDLSGVDSGFEVDSQECDGGGCLVK